jgi:TetR/AcrR family transcriptional regulator, transcriptional repressor for nem operon
MADDIHNLRKHGATPQRLLEAAVRLFYHQGVTGTSLSDIAQAADVPLGNVYYHFRTKEDLMDAVVEARTEQLRVRFADAAREPDPLERLKLVLRDAKHNRHEIVAYGCPFAALTQDTKPGRTQLFEMFLDFAATQFELLGWGGSSRELAEEFVSTLQGSFLLANGTASDAFLERQLNRLEAWLERVSAARSPVVTRSSVYTAIAHR